jgi:hypothetical protein
MRAVRVWIAAMGCLALAACGGGGGGSGSSSSGGNPTPPPAGLSYPATTPLRINVAMGALTPAVTGTPTGYTVAPALPAGLALSATTGEISGTPTALATAANYTVTASNAGGSTTATLSLAVNDAPPDISYSAGTFAWTTKVPVSLLPTSTGGAITQWSIDRAPPAGLTFDTTNGRITGTPTRAEASASFTISANNSGGSDSFVLSLAVTNGTLLDLGHSGTLLGIQHDGARMMTEDDGNHAVLWNAQTGAQLASANDCESRCTGLAGPTAVFKSRAAFEMRDSSDGALLARVAVPAASIAWWVLSSDGSYVCGGSASSLGCWSRTGTMLFARLGDFRDSAGRAFAAPGELRLARSVALGTQYIETTAIPAGTPTSSSTFPGNFNAWFRDGERFATTAGNTVTVYSRSVVQQDIATLPTVERLGGQNDLFWTADGTLRIYRVGNGATAIATFPIGGSARLGFGPNTIGMLPGGNQVSVIDLSGATPTRIDSTAPVGSLWAFGANSPTDWAVGNTQGVVIGEPGPGAPQIYALGRAHGIAGNAHRFAIATAANRILHYDSQTRALVGELAAPAAKLEISDDGTLLAAGPGPSGSNYSDDYTIRLFSLPAGGLVSSWQYPQGAMLPIDFTLAGSGSALGQMFVQPAIQEVQLFGAGTIWQQASTGEPIRLSPNGGFIAVASGPRADGVGTVIAWNGTLFAAVAGWPVGWLDDGRLLLNRYRTTTSPGMSPFEGTIIVNTSGQTLASPALPEMLGVQTVNAGTVYWPERNLILDLATGNTLWSSSLETTGRGAVIGNAVVFASGSEVRIEPR